MICVTSASKIYIKYYGERIPIIYVFKDLKRKDKDNTAFSMKAKTQTLNAFRKLSSSKKIKGSKATFSTF